MVATFIAINLKGMWPKLPKTKLIYASFTRTVAHNINKKCNKEIAVISFRSVYFHRFLSSMSNFNCVFSMDIVHQSTLFYTYLEICFSKYYLHFCHYPRLSNYNTPLKLKIALSHINKTIKHLLDTI